MLWGTPGWLSQLSVRLWLRSRSHSSWVQTTSQALSCQHSRSRRKNSRRSTRRNALRRYWWQGPLLAYQRTQREALGCRRDLEDSFILGHRLNSRRMSEWWWLLLRCDLGLTWQLRHIEPAIHGVSLPDVPCIPQTSLFPLLPPFSIPICSSIVVNGIPLIQCLNLKNRNYPPKIYLSFFYPNR